MMSLKRSKKIAVAVCLAAIVVLVLWGIARTRAPHQKPAAPAVAVLSQSDVAFQNSLASIVANYRKIIVLLEDEKSLDPDQASDAGALGQSLYYRNQDLLKSLSEKLSAEIEAAGSQAPAAVPPEMAHFLDELEKEADWHDADKLAFAEIVEDVNEAAAGLPETYKKKTGLSGRIEDDRKALKEIQSLYDRELDKIFGRFETRGMAVHREAWEKYVAFLKTKFTREQLLQEYAGRTKKKAPPQQEKQGPGKQGTPEFPPKSLVLTFDDGPHLRYTPRIMEILKKYDVKGVFFEIGSNIGSFKEDGTIRLTKASQISGEVAASGFCLGNHSYSHAYLPKLADTELKSEIERTNKLLAAVTDAPISLFRPPYGAQNEKVLEAIHAHNMRSLLWHIDSKDWADPVPKSIADRVVREVSERGRGIILFHDINGRTVEALPLVLETLKEEGYRFLSWNGKAFSDESRGEPGQATAQPQPAPELYRESWAVIIGIDKYLHWPQLQYAVNDAKGVNELLVRKYRFKPENVTMLLNEEATREKILDVLGDAMGNPDKVKREDRVFVFFAGHGTTRKLPSGRDLGYIIPVDADTQNYQGQSISMTNFQDISEAIPAKHVFFVMDSCYSGLALTRGAGLARSENYLREISRRTSRQMLTAGGADQQVADNGPNGHSVFTWAFLQGLEGQADLNNDGIITASELAAYVGPAVSAIGKQTPAFGSLAGSEGGEFIFQPRQNTEFLSELSVQLDQEAIQLNDQLDQVRRQIAEKRLRNKKLQKELAQAQAAAGATNGSAAGPSAKNAGFAGHMDTGSSLFKERKYDEALKEFLAAARMNPGSPLAANNVGYMYHKLGQYDTAVEWFEKTIALDPQRAIAYGNLGDAYFNLNRKQEARKAFLKYLELAPASNNAGDIEAKLKKME